MDLREQLQTETVADVGFREPVTIGLDASVREAVDVMQRNKVGCVLVVDDVGALRGIFTERNLVVRVHAAGGPIDGPVAQFMTPDPKTCQKDDPIHAALGKMNQGGFRHLPVVDGDGKLIGSMSVKRAVHFITDHLPAAVLNVPPDPDNIPATQEGG